MDFSKEYISYKSALEASKQCSQYTGAAVSIVRTETGTWLIKSSKPITLDQMVGINPYHLIESERDRQIITSYVRSSIFCRMCGGDGGPGGRCSRCGGNGLEPDWDADG